MAARWGAGEETLTIGGMELFTAGGPLQCQVFEDDGPCTGLSDLSLSPLDSGGILGSFQGFIDTSLISVIEDPSTQLLQNNGTFDEENELSLLTALTEILDNADDENLSPFDTIPDTDLLVSTRDREGAALQKFLSLSRTPPELDISLLDEQRRPGSGKTDWSAALNWEQCLEGIGSTPKRRNRLKSIRDCMSRMVRKEPTQQRSDGEEEELASPDKAIEEGSDMIFDRDLMSSPLMRTEFEQDALLTQSTPCIINTENVSLHDLVKYMHPYCLPALTVCLDEVDDNLENAVFLEIVSEQGDCIKVPVIMEHPEEALDCEEHIDLSALELLNSELDLQTDVAKEPQEEHQPVEQPSDDKPLVTTSLEELITRENRDSHDLLEKQILESREKEPEVVVDDKNMNPRTDKLEEAMEVSAQENNEPDSSALNRPDDHSLNQKKTKRNKQPESCKSKTKCKSKNKSSSTGQILVEKVTVQKTVPSTLKRASNNSLQESDFLIKQLDQAKKDSQMELRSSRVTRAKSRNRGNLDNASSSEKKLTSDDRKLEKIKSNEKDSSKQTGRNPWVQPNNSNGNEPGVAERPQDTVLVPGSDNKTVAPEEISPAAASDVPMEETSAVEDKPSSEGVSTTLAKDVKPKSLSLSEYRKRLQHRKPNTEEKACESVSESKWPSIPEPPTELAEIPCLIAPGKDALPSKSIKIPPSLGGNLCSSATARIPSGQDVPSNLVSAPSTSQPVFTETRQQTQPEAMASSVMVTNSYAMPLQPNVPPPFYPPTWPVSSHPAYYPTLPTVSLYPNCLPPDPLHAVTMQPPMVSWPPFPPPPIAMGAVHSSDPAGWPPGYQPSYWQPPVIQPEIAGDLPAQPSAGNVGGQVPQVMFSSASNVQQEVKISQNTQGAPKSSSQTVQPSRQTSRTPVCETTGSAVADKPVKGILKQNKSPSKSLEIRRDSSVKQSCSSVPKTNPSPSKSVVNHLPKIPPDPLPTLPPGTKTSALAPDSKSANQVVFKILELLRKAQSKVVVMKPAPETSGSAKEPVPAILDPPARAESDLCAKTETPHPETSSAAAKPPALVRPATPAAASAPSAVESKCSEQVASDKPPTGQPPKIEDGKQRARAPASPETLLPATETGVRLSLPDADKCRGPAETFTSEKGIEATDLTSLLEQFEQSEAKDDHVAQSPDFKLAVGNSGSEKPTEKKVHDRLLAPELASTAGLTPPATPPHQLWKTIAVGSVPGKSKSLANLQERTCPSPIKTAKLIDAQPLPQSRLRNRNPAPATKNAPQPVHVASGDHDYCILSSSSQPEKFPVPDQPQGEADVPAASLSCEGSRWNVKHHQNITIKPIVQFNKKPADRACQKLPAKPTTASSGVLCQSVKSDVPCDAAPKELLNQLDHRTTCSVQAAEAQPGSVFMSPDSSPCRSENWDAGTGVGRDDDSSVSRRALRCYRKYSASQSPEKSVTRGRRSSRSHSSSSSSSRSCSRTPPPKRKRYSSRSHRSQSSSRSRSSTRSTSSSSSTSCSSRSFSPSSSRSRLRSRSRSSQRYRSRSRRYESRDSYNKQKMVHKERAIEERRVVYIGKINNQMTRSELKHRFSVFGDIEECTIHFREHGDNYGFVTYHDTREAFTAIENGHKLRLPDELPFDLCFGGRRQFCKRNYADLDSYHDEFCPASSRNKYEELDFDTLLKQAQKNNRR